MTTAEQAEWAEKLAADVDARALAARIAAEHLTRQAAEPEPDRE